MSLPRFTSVYVRAGCGGVAVDVAQSVLLLPLECGVLSLLSLDCSPTQDAQAASSSLIDGDFVCVVSAPRGAEAMPRRYGVMPDVGLFFAYAHRRRRMAGAPSVAVTSHYTMMVILHTLQCILTSSAAPARGGHGSCDAPHVGDGHVIHYLGEGHGIYFLRWYKQGGISD